MPSSTYTTDGSTPTARSPIYAAAIPVATTTTIKAMATASGKTDSAVASATYTLQAGTPVISPAAGTYATAQSVTLTSATPGAAIHYTTDGSTPTSASPTYTAAIALPVGAAAATNIKAIALATGFADSAVASAAYVINLPQAATPTFSPGAGTCTLAQSVIISSTTTGAVIYYTADGSAPTTASPLYAGAVPVAASKTLKAIATATGYGTSSVGTAAYVIAGGSGIDFLTVCGGFLDKQVSLMTTCLHANPDFITGLFGSLQSFCRDTQEEIAAGLITYNATQGTACASAVQALTCADLAAVGGVTAPAACDAALVGTVNTGGACYSSGDCKTGYCTWDYSTTATCPGTCQPFVLLGGYCSTSPCAEGLACDGPVGTPVCRTESPVGGACPCQSSLWCDTAGGGAGVCKAPLPLGASCTTGSGDHLAASPICKALLADGATCNPSFSGMDCASG